MGQRRPRERCGQSIQDRLVRDLPRKPHVTGRHLPQRRAHQRLAPMRRRAQHMADPGAPGPFEELADRLAGLRQHQRAAAQQGPQQDLQAAVAPDVIERAPDRTRPGDRTVLQRPG